MKSPATATSRMGIGGGIARADLLILAAALALTLARLAAIAITPLGLGVEEAQYWLWGQVPAAGYFTKPPMIAWLIRGSVEIFGNTVFGVKAPAPIIQLLAALLAGRLVREAAGDKNAGRLAVLIWITMPASAVAGFLISTDSPMLLFLLAMLVCLAPLARGGDVSGLRIALGGIFLGLAMLAKYAAIYAVIGIALWWLWEGRKTHRLRPRPIAVFIAAAGLTALPNIIWNLQNGFAAIAHLGDNAGLGDGGGGSIIRSFEFLAAQAGILGPGIFIIAIIAIIAAWKNPGARFWLALAAPAPIAITMQAYSAPANANWAVAMLPPLMVLVAAWPGRQKRGRRAAWAGIIAAIGINTAISIAALGVVITGSLGAFTPKSDPLRRLKGWEEHGQVLTEVMEASGAEAVITTRRRDAAHFAWAVRGRGWKVEIIDADGIPGNHYEAEYLRRPRPGRRVVLAGGAVGTAIPDDMEITGAPAASLVQIAKGRSRGFAFYPAVEK